MLTWIMIVDLTGRNGAVMVKLATKGDVHDTVGRYESSNSTAIFVRRLYLRFSRRYRAGAARGLAFWLKRRSGGPVLVIVIILRSSAARV